MRAFIGFVLVIAAAIGLAVFTSHMHPGGDLPPEEKQAEQDAKDAQAKNDALAKFAAGVDHSPGAFDAVKQGALHATLVFEGKPPIQIELYPKAAPETVEHISNLIKQNFYHKIKVHRVENGAKGPGGSGGLFLFQFGDPESATAAVSEFQAKQIGGHGAASSVPLEVKLPHVKGSIGLARQDDFNSGDSQMYINTADNPSLDGKYCIFGRVVGGLDVLNTIKLGDVISRFDMDK